MLIDTIKQRRSIRKYKDKQISKEDLMYIIDAGRFAPTAGNDQPWIFGIINDKKLIEQLSKCSHNQRWITTAPVVIALCTRRMSEEDMEVEKFRLGKLKDEIYNIDTNVLDIICAQEHQALIAAENIILAARELNIGSCIIAYVDLYRASKVLRVPNNYLVSYLVTLGYEDIKPTQRGVKSVDEVIFYNVYDK